MAKRKRRAGRVQWAVRYPNGHYWADSDFTRGEVERWARRLGGRAVKIIITEVQPKPAKAKRRAKR